MRCGVEVDDYSAVVSEYDEAEQDSKCRGRYREEVDRHNIANMVLQEGPPRLRRRLMMADLVLIHRSLRRLVPKESEFRTDSRRAPERIFATHAPNQLADLGVDLRPAGFPGSRFPSPVELEALLVPTDDGVGLDDEQR